MTRIFNANQQCIGEIRVNEDTEGVQYVRHGLADMARHHLNNLGAWAIDVTAINALEQESDGDDSSLVVIYIKDRKGVRRIQATLGDFHRKAYKKNFGHGEQLILPDAHWKREDALQGILFL